MTATSSLTVVTVTYGDRWHLLEKVLQGCQSLGVRQVVVVDNASDRPIGSLISSFPMVIDVVRLPRNTGSAIGFKSGIERALQMGSEYILLLDDDTVPAPGSIEMLCMALKSGIGNHSGPVAVLGNRTNFAAGSASEIESMIVRLRPASFLSFHVYDIPGKVWRRLRKLFPATVKRNAPPLIKTEACTYGGLLFHRSLIEEIGLPREEFVLYVDDYELTYRITSSGGSIALVTDAKINDLEMQWNTGERFTNTFKAWLLGEGDLRAYYTARNICYFETILQRHSEWLRWVNKTFYLVLLNYYARRLGKHDRLSRLHNAISDGESGKMGINPEFPL